MNVPNVAILAPPFLLGSTTSFIRTIENLDQPESPEINNLSDLSKLDKYKSDLITLIYIKVFSGIFQAFTGNSQLETLKGVEFLLFLIVLVELIIIVGSVYYGVSKMKFYQLIEDTTVKLHKFATTKLPPTIYVNL